MKLVYAVAGDFKSKSSFSLPSSGTVAHKIMQKYGFREGQGLGKHEQGLSTALSVEKTSKRGGKIIVGDATEKGGSPPQPAFRVGAGAGRGGAGPLWSPQEFGIMVHSSSVLWTQTLQRLAHLLFKTDLEIGRFRGEKMRDWQKINSTQRSDFMLICTRQRPC